MLEFLCSLLNDPPDQRRRYGSECTSRSRWLVAFAAAVLFIELPSPLHAQEALLPGQAFVTKFSDIATVNGPGGPTTVIDLAGTVGTAIDLRAPRFQADGRHWLDELHTFSVTAGDVGQVFGVALDDANPPNIYLTATSAFGLHRNADNSGWMAGMWGPGGGPGTVYRLNAANHYRPEIFANVALSGRANTGAALGNIAFDRWHHQFYVSDLETGMIHRLALADGADRGSYDHGVAGRASFTDAASNTTRSLPSIAFDPTSAARITNCPSGDFTRTPSCWNFADFRRRVWGVDVRSDAAGRVRLYYAVWGSQAFGNQDWATAGEDQKNAVWSVAIADDGSFDTSGVRREFLLPEFFRSPEAIARAGISNPVADVAFPTLGPQNVMLVAERGGIRNLGLSAEEAFAYPHEARVLRYELGAAGVWQPVGRYDVGFYDRKNEGPPYLRAGAAGGAAFGLGYDAKGEIDPTKPNDFIWMTGDALCSPAGPCFDPATNTHSNNSQVSGLQGVALSGSQQLTPPAAFQPYPAVGPATPASGPDHSYMVDVDINVDASGNPIPAELASNDATRIGDVVVFQPTAPKTLDLMIAKRALDARCQAGGMCRFEVVITNVGDLPYSGPLVVSDIGRTGSTFAVPPSPDWICQQQFTNIHECSHAPVELAPGASVSFQVTSQIPAWWRRPVFDNCVELTTPGAGIDARTYNNKACGYAPTGPGAPDLQLSKFGVDGQCDWLNRCLFVVRITNVGAAPYSGPLNIHDDVKFGGTALVTSALPPWTCGPAGAASFNCSHPPVTLAPGDYREVSLLIAAGPIVPGHTHVRNCALINWGGAARDYNPGNEYDCATISRFPPGYADAIPMLDISKLAEPFCSKPPAGPGGGWLCTYEVTITNNGGAPYFGPLQVTDDAAGAPLPATLAGVVFSPAWSCAPGKGVVGPQMCSRAGLPGGLQAGQSQSVILAYEVGAAVAVPSWLQNCATIASDHDGDGIPENYKSCATAQICDPASGPCPQDILVQKVPSSLNPCFPGFPCGFDVHISNLGNLAYPAPVLITESPDIPVGTPTVVGPAGWSCAPAAPGYACTGQNPIPGGTTVVLHLEIVIPPDYPGPTYRNCAGISPSPGPNNVNSANDQDCVTAFVPFPDLAPSGGTTCQRGASCTLDVAINNKGLLPFIGHAGLRGTLSPAVNITSAAGLTSGLTCKVTGAGAYECDGPRLNIAPGEAARIRVVVVIPADFASNTITHNKDVVWPEPAVKDKRPENDHQVSIITIAAGATITCSGGAVQNNQCVCPQGTNPQQTGTNAYRCVAPPIICTGGAIQNNQCICPQGTYPQQTGTNAYRCVAPPITCVGGTVRNNECACPQGTHREQTGAHAYRCVSDITCTGGTVRNKECICPQDNYPQQTSTNAYRCVPAITCVGGTVRNNACVCPQGSHPQQTGTNAYRCVATPITCTGGTVSNNECVCPQGSHPQQTGANAYQCVPTITCTGGTVSNNTCVCPQGSHPQQAGANAYRCVATIICSGGTVSNNTCVCPQGSQPQQSGPNAYRCVATITCSGGTVSNNACVCPQGSQPQQTGANAYRCVATITCSGGTVSNNACVCPQGSQPQQTGANAYRCVATIICKGGTVQNNQCVCPQGTHSQQTGTNSYQCVANITCNGGTVRNNTCICPQGSQPQQSGPNAYRCVANITCSGGTVRNNECVCPRGFHPQQTGTNAFRCVADLR